MNVSQKSLSTPSFGALICESSSADPRQREIMSTLMLDRKYFSGSLLRKLQRQDIDVYVKPCREGNLSISLKQNVGKNWFIPVDNNDEFMMENFDSDDLFVLDEIKKYAGVCQNFLDKRMFDNKKNKNKISAIYKNMNIIV